MRPECVAELRAPVADGGTSVGTGYAISPRHVLTARHVVAPDDVADGATVIMRFPARDDREVEGRVVWRGTGKVDVALVEAAEDLSEDVDKRIPLGDGISVREGTKWISQGFPRVKAKQPAVRRPHSFDGTVFPWARGAERVELTVHVPPPLREVAADPARRERAWGGMSGAAVFVDETIVAVIRESDLDFEGQKLEATPVSAFLEHPDFRRLLDLDAKDEEDERLEAGLTSLLQGDAEATALLATRLLSVETDSGPHAVAKALMSARAVEVIRALAPPMTSTGRAVGVAPRLAMQLLSLLLPRAPELDHGFQELLSLMTRAEPGAGVVKVALSHPPLVDALLARLDGRPCFFTLEGSEVLAEASLSEGAAPPTGFDLEGDGTVSDITKTLGPKLGAPPNLVGPGLIRSINEELAAQLALPYDPPFYIVFFGNEETNVTTMARRVKETFPNLRVLVMGESHDGATHTIILHGLKEILNKAGRLGRAHEEASE